MRTSTTDNGQDMKATEMPMNRQMDKEDMGYMYSRILHSHKKNEILPFAALWMDLENIMLNEVSQRKTNTVWYYLYVESKNNTNECICTRETDSQIYKQTSGYQWGHVRGEGQSRGIGVRGTNYYV